MDTNNLCDDVIILILNLLDKKEIIESELVCKQFKNVIRNHHWLNNQFYVEDLNILNIYIILKLLK